MSCVVSAGCRFRFFVIVSIILSCTGHVDNLVNSSFEMIHFINVIENKAMTERRPTKNKKKTHAHTQRRKMNARETFERSGLCCRKLNFNDNDVARLIQWQFPF